MKLKSTFNENALKTEILRKLPGGTDYTAMTDIISCDDVVYLNVLTLAESFFGVYAGMLVPNGIEYVSVNLNEIEKLTSETAAPATAEIDSDKAVKILKNSFTQFIDWLEEASVDVEPSFLSNEEDKAMLSINNENVSQLANNLGKILDKELKNSLSAIAEELKTVKGCEELAAQISDGIKNSWEEVQKGIDELKTLDITKENPENVSLDIDAFSLLSGEKGARDWNYGTSAELKDAESTITFTVNSSVKERTETVEIVAPKAEITQDVETFMAGLPGIMQ